MTTTRSPTDTPFSTSTTASPWAPSLTTRRRATPSATAQTTLSRPLETMAEAGTETADGDSRTVSLVTALMPGLGAGALAPSSKAPGPSLRRTG